MQRTLGINKSTTGASRAKNFSVAHIRVAELPEALVEEMRGHGKPHGDGRSCGPNTISGVLFVSLPLAFILYMCGI